MLDLAISDLFHVWQSAALRKINNHHRLGDYVIANAYGSLILDEFMPLSEQANLVASLIKWKLPTKLQQHKPKV